MPTQTTGHFTFADWEESPAGTSETDPSGTSPGQTGPRLAHASVTNSFSGGIEAAGTTCDYTIAYVTEKTGTFAGMELLVGSVDGRKGAFVLEERGSFDADSTVHCAFEVVPGSGTGELTGLRGTGGFTYRHGESPVAYTFDYELD